MENIFETWNWYIAGPIIGLFVPILLVATNKLLGISSSFTHICTLLLPATKKMFSDHNWESNSWKLYFVLGITIGGFLSSEFLSETTIAFLPAEYYSPLGFLKLFLGGILVGFGTRYANGCTSGHSITGLATLQFSSLKATISFFIGGLLFTYTMLFIN